MKSFHLISIVLITICGQIFGINRVLIAILSQDNEVSNSGQSYIVASYVKYLESAGARVVPVLINQNKEYYERIVDLTNGLLIPGEGQDLYNSGYAKAGQMIWDYVKNRKSSPYPIWGTCLGFELIMSLVDPNLTLNKCNSTDVSNNLHFISDLNKSRLFNGVDNIAKILSTEKVTYNDNKKCLYYGNTTENITNFFRILSTTEDSNGFQYISTIESINESFPVYGTQWHPEKNQFEWKLTPNGGQISHSFNSVLIGQYMANFFVSEARRSCRKGLRIDEELKLLIYNHKPVYTGGKDSYENEQVYYFNSCWSSHSSNFLPRISLILITYQFISF